MLLLLLLLLPSQLALHFWPSWSLINGIRSDYLSPTVYLTDLIILGLMVFNRLKFKVPLWVILIFSLNLLFSTSPLVTLYKWARVYEYFWLYKYLTQNIQYSVFGIQLAVIWTCVLTWWQFIKQGSVGGLWYWLGERTFNLYTPGIAKVGFLDLGLVLRPYATLPHPNALAGFLLVSSLLLVATNKKIATLALLTVPLTFSKSAILAEICVIIFWLIKKFKNKVLYLAFLFPVFLYFYLPTSTDSVPQRLWLNQQARQVITAYPLSGVGLGNFVSQVPSVRQPVHNIYLLLIAELGIPVSIVIFYLGFKKLLTIDYWPLIIPMVIGLVDHYWITLHQNILLLVLLLSVVQLKSKHDNSL